MRVIVHISDIHFGRTDDAVVDRLVEKVGEIGPDLVVVSGDLTQRARHEQFKAARDFLDRLPKPQIVVPGNHDVPLYNVYNRFVHPLRRFKKYITGDLMPMFCDEEIAVLGVNTARSLTIKGGRISRGQIAEIRRKLSDTAGGRLRIIVTHHPFDLPEESKTKDVVGRAREKMRELSGCGAEVFLSGHLHVSNAATMRSFYQHSRSPLIVQAGTAASTRARGEPNSFNVIEIDGPSLVVKRFQCGTGDEEFVEREAQRFIRTESGWSRG